ncbi:hypothetical protein RHOFW510R12_01170 [Rhodanobacter sp. FW510-R12]|uniref:hypothetical protein n=1 Tax=Rhodanobacter thiooxydans TaxID=416169 RepID=UPI0009201302|nr:hypothetical protein [Rhodanobacter thiooxydans]UJJ56650.1 hypothetical protein LRK53_18755 [Rhodanobacter thiooxydans]
MLPTIESILADPSASDWLKASLTAALPRDPVDAANDACMLKHLLEQRCDAVLQNTYRSEAH